MQQKNSEKQKSNEFWAEKIAKQVMQRKKFHFLDKDIPELKKYTVKSSASLSGVLHIGRLSDLIRGEAVYKALKQLTDKAEFIYVAEDMDPLRKVPKGVSQKFAEYIGHSVSMIPDPFGCHESYSKHFFDEFLEVNSEFLEYEPKIYSMKDLYEKGAFVEHILKLAEKKDVLFEILEKGRKEPLPKDYSFFKPICKNCNNLQTTVVQKFEGTKVHYVCKDYAFEKYVAKGCNYEGVADITKDKGKLAWKSEWAAQWHYFSVVAEGAGKEYNVPNSAFWINAEICERIFDFPMPVPIFYEHLTIDGKKMSASVGNVIYGSEWLSVARPETLKLLFLKRINKARDFSWQELPLLELELDRLLKGEINIETEKQLLPYLKAKKPLVPINAEYSLVLQLVQIFEDKNKIIEILKKLGKEPKSREEEQLLLERIEKAKQFVKTHYNKEMLFDIANQENIKKAKEMLSDNEKKALKQIIEKINKINEDEKEVHNKVTQLFFNEIKEKSIKPKEFFPKIYLALIGKNRGPKIGTLFVALGKKRFLEIVKQLLDDKHKNKEHG